ncbi:hypothetical protein GCM10010218_12790 [Streptomyces mashuensis]|uniref:Uncharacterized protein n=1 Tax=Streptomyces mashuensis TaxID=33904 RepID=A0A919B0Y2_9ACTN|nr:hypothetical protein GCM10010218_12790 [Streptomyces mashuensis]
MPNEPTNSTAEGVGLSWRDPRTPPEQGKPQPAEKDHRPPDVDVRTWITGMRSVSEGDPADCHARDGAAPQNAEPDQSPHSHHISRRRPRRDRGSGWNSSLSFAQGSPLRALYSARE